MTRAPCRRSGRPRTSAMSMKLITAPPWIDPPHVDVAGVGNIRTRARLGSVGLKMIRPVCAAKRSRRKIAPAVPAGMFRILARHRRGASASLAQAARSADHLLGLGDRLRRVEPLGADVGAVHDRVAAIEPERVLELVEPFAGRLVAAVGEPAIGLEQHRRPEELVAVPPIARAAGRAAGAQDALVQAVELLAVVAATAAAPCPTARASAIFSHGSIEAYCA